MIKKLAAFYAHLSKRERLILAGTCVALAVFSMDRLVLSPAARQMKLSETKVRDEEAAIRKSLQVLLRKGQINADVQRFAVYSLEAKKPEEQMTSFFKEIETLATNASVSLLYVKPGTEKGEGNTKKYFANLECEGQMGEIVSFFHHIEDTKDILKVEKYDIQPKNKESSEVRCVVTVSLTVLS